MKDLWRHKCKKFHEFSDSRSTFTHKKYLSIIALAVTADTAKFDPRKKIWANNFCELMRSWCIGLLLVVPRNAIKLKGSQRFSLSLPLSLSVSLSRIRWYHDTRLLSCHSRRIKCEFRRTPLQRWIKRTTSRLQQCNSLFTYRTRERRCVSPRSSRRRSRTPCTFFRNRYL